MSAMSDEKKHDPRRSNLIAALAEGCTLEEAALKVGVSSRTVRRWREGDPELDDAVGDAMSAVDDRVQAVTLANCLDPDPVHNTLRIFWLKNRRREVFGEKIQTDITSGGQPLRPRIVEVMVPAGGEPTPPVPEAD